MAKPFICPRCGQTVTRKVHTDATDLLSRCNGVRLVGPALPRARYGGA